MAPRKNNVSPLSWTVPIVDRNGMPTDEFMRKFARQQQFNDTIPDLSTPAAVSAVLDKLGDAQGDLLMRGASAWGVLTPGTAGQTLTTGGPGANDSWKTPAGPEINLSLGGTMDDTEFLGSAIFSRTVNFAANFSGSQGKAGAAATLASHITIKKNGANAGTIAFAIAATTATFTTAGGLALSFVAGDVISFFGPSPQDVTLINVVANLVGSYP